MKRAIAIVAGSLLAVTNHALATGGVVQWDIEKKDLPPQFRRFRRRSGTFEEIVTNEDHRGGYFATCSLGTPYQNLTLQLDTGSSDIWVPDSTAKVCSEVGTRGCDFGTCM